MGLTRVGSYVAMAWLLGISLNLVSTGRFFDIAARDVALAIAAYTPARLSEARQPAEAVARSRAEAVRAPRPETAA